MTTVFAHKLYFYASSCKSKWHKNGNCLLKQYTSQWTWLNSSIFEKLVVHNLNITRHISSSIPLMKRGFHQKCGQLQHMWHFTKILLMMLKLSRLQEQNYSQNTNNMVNMDVLPFSSLQLQRVLTSKTKFTERSYHGNLIPGEGFVKRTNQRGSVSGLTRQV